MRTIIRDLDPLDWGKGIYFSKYIGLVMGGRCFRELGNLINI